MQVADTIVIYLFYLFVYFTSWLKLSLPLLIPLWSFLVFQLFSLLSSSLDPLPSCPCLALLLSLLAQSSQPYSIYCFLSLDSSGWTLPHSYNEPSLALGKQRQADLKWFRSQPGLQWVPGQPAFPSPALWSGHVLSLWLFHLQLYLVSILSYFP